MAKISGHDNQSTYCNIFDTHDIFITQSNDKNLAEHTVKAQ